MHYDTNPGIKCFSVAMYLKMKAYQGAYCDR